MPAMQVRMSESEYSMARAAALGEGLSLSEWVRRRMFGVPGGVVVEIPEFGELVVEGLVAASEVFERCPEVVSGERCGRQAGHGGPHVWANGD